MLGLTPAKQEPGEFVVTFPGAYHAGFSTGLNCGEAVNFAPPDWLRFGAAAAERLRAFRKPPLLSYEWLLLKVSVVLSCPAPATFPGPCSALSAAACCACPWPA